jgi:hypothetical protein
MLDSHSKELLPGQQMVEQGLADLARKNLTESALLVLIAAPRLKSLGIAVPQLPLPASPEHMLYSRLEERLGAGAHSCYNGLLRRIVSYAHARESEVQNDALTKP